MMNSFFVFKFSYLNIGEVIPWKGTYTAERIKFKLLKSNCSVEDAAGLVMNDNTMQSFRLVRPDLSMVPSAQHENRRNYLMKTVVERYFPNDPESMELYFSEGA